jgi:hypothetical protein
MFRGLSRLTVEHAWTYCGAVGWCVLSFFRLVTGFSPSPME